MMGEVMMAKFRADAFDPDPDLDLDLPNKVPDFRSL